MTKEENEHLDAYEFLRMTRERLPDVMQKISPVRYRNLGWAHDPDLLTAAVSQQLLALYMRQQGDKGLETTNQSIWIEFGENWKKYDNRCYFVTPELMAALERTHFDEDIEFSDFVWPLHTFAVVIPRGYGKIGEGLELTCFGVTQGKWDTSPIDTMGVGQVCKHPELEGEPYFSLVAPLANGAQYSLREPLTGFNIQMLDTLETIVDHLGSDEKQTVEEVPELKKIVRYFLPLLAFFSTEPDDVVGGGNEVTPKPKSRKGTSFIRTWRDPFILGTKEKKYYRNTSGEEGGVKKAEHWRAGHFRRQAYGTKMSLRKIIRIRPSHINAAG